MTAENTKSNGELYLKIAYFVSLAGASMLFGFSLTLNKFRKNQPETIEQAMYEEGSALARKALMRGTIYSVCGFGLFAFASYHLVGKQMIQRFNDKAIKSDEGDIKYLEDIIGTKLRDKKPKVDSK